MAISSKRHLTENQRSFLERPQFEALNLTERQVLGLALRKGSVTQAFITQTMDVAQQTVSRTVSSLVERGYLVTKDRVSQGRRGKPSVTVELLDDFAYSVGISIMADTVSFAVMDFRGKIVRRSEHHMPSMKSARVLALCETLIEDAINEHVLLKDRLFGLGIAVTGYFVPDKPGFNTPPNLPDWAFVDVEQTFTEKFKLPVWVENDGNAAAIGESMIGVGRWASNFAYIYVSSGLGGGVIVNGELMRGDLGNAGEFAGILPYNVYAHPTLELLRQILVSHGVQIDSIYQLVTEYDPEWPGVDEWVHKTQAAYTLIASAASAVLDTTAVVLGGRMPKRLAEQLIPSIDFYSTPRRSFARPTPKVVPAEAEGEVTAIGAAALPLKAMYFA